MTHLQASLHLIHQDTPHLTQVLSHHLNPAPIQQLHLQISPQLSQAHSHPQCLVLNQVLNLHCDHLHDPLHILQPNPATSLRLCQVVNPVLSQQIFLVASQVVNLSPLPQISLPHIQAAHQRLFHHHSRLLSLLRYQQLNQAVSLPEFQQCNPLASQH